MGLRRRQCPLHFLLRSYWGKSGQFIGASICALKLFNQSPDDICERLLPLSHKRRSGPPGGRVRPLGKAISLIIFSVWNARVYTDMTHK